MLAVVPSLDTILMFGGAASIPAIIVEFIRYLRERQSGQNAQTGTMSGTIGNLFKEIGELKSRCANLESQIESLRGSRYQLAQAIETYREILRRVRAKSGLTGEQIEQAAHDDETEVVSKLRGDNAQGK